MKQYFKKSLALLLVATNFTFLCTNLNLTHAEASKNSLNSKDASLKNSSDFFNFVLPSHKETYKDLPFSIEKEICNKDPKFCEYDALKQLFKNAKDKIYDTLGLNYTDKIKTPIVVPKVFNSPDVEEDLQEDLGYFHPFSNTIFIKRNYLFDEEILSHEMTHAYVHNYLNENSQDFKSNLANIFLNLIKQSNTLGINFINLGMNEGLAAQINKLGYWGSPFGLFSSTEKLLFKDPLPSNGIEIQEFYALHQYIVNEWIKAEGKDVVKKYLEKVKNGEDSVKAFLNLGGDKIIENYKKKQNNFLFWGSSAILSILIPTGTLLIKFLARKFTNLKKHFKNEKTFQKSTSTFNSNDEF